MSLHFPKIHPTLYVILTGEILLLISGSTLTWSSSGVQKLANSTLSPFEYELSPEELSWISSLLPLGAAVGPFLYGYMWNKFGRRRVVLSILTPFLVAYTILASAKLPALFYLARFLAGIAVGGTFATIPLYIGEIVPKSITRRALISTLYCALCIGILLSYILGHGASFMQFNCVLAVLSAVLFILFLCLGVECPHYYIYVEDYETARIILEVIRIGYEQEYIDKEMMEIKAQISEEKRGKIRDMIGYKAATKTLVIIVGLMFFQQFSGISVVFFYCWTIFNMTGVALAPEICFLIVGMTQLIASIATPIIVEVYGGKKPLLWSALGMALSEITLGIYCLLGKHQIDVQTVSFIPIMALTLIVVFYNLGFGPVPIMMMEEIFPAKVKTVSVCTVWSMNWLMAFFVTKYFYSMVEIFGTGELFLMFSVFCVLSAVFTQLCIIETKDKTLEEIQEILSN